jgi:cyclase
VIASGGVGGLDDLANGILEGHADAVLAASIFHFATVRISEVKSALSGAGYPVR